MKPLHCQMLRLLSGVGSIVLVSQESPFWVLAVAPWIALCIFGILALIPLLVTLGSEVGLFHADAIGDDFLIWFGFGAPMVLAMILAEIYRLGARILSPFGSEEVIENTEDGDSL